MGYKNIDNINLMEKPLSASMKDIKTLAFNPVTDMKESDEDSAVEERNKTKEVASAMGQKKHQAMRNIHGLAGGKSTGKECGMSLSLSSPR